jgi:hypothetical protein
VPPIDARLGVDRPMPEHDGHAGPDDRGHDAPDPLGNDVLAARTRPATELANAPRLTHGRRPVEWPRAPLVPDRRPLIIRSEASWVHPLPLRAMSNSRANRVACRARAHTSRRQPGGHSLRRPGQGGRPLVASGVARSPSTTGACHRGESAPLWSHSA